MMLPHHISWKGWGLAVPLLTIFWIILSVASMLIFDDLYPGSLYTPDKAVAAASAWRLMASAFGVSTISVLLVQRHRRQQREKPGSNVSTDEFMYLPLRFWPSILAACTIGTFAWSFFVRE